MGIINKIEIKINLLLILIFWLGHKLIIYIKIISIPPKIIKIIRREINESWKYT